MRVKNNIYASEIDICVAALMWPTVSVTIYHVTLQNVREVLCSVHQCEFVWPLCIVTPTAM
jgi:hypothetical protein